MGTHGLIILILLASLIAVPACRKTEKEQEEEAIQKAKSTMEQVGQGAQNMARGFEKMARGMKQMKAGANKPVEPVSFRKLQEIFSDLSGWEKSEPTGEKMTAPVSFSQARVTYTKGKSTIEANVMDTGFNRMLIAPYSMFLAVGYEKETENGYEKSVKLGEYPGWEKWNSKNKRGEIHAVVGQRFLVSFDGSNISDTKVLYELAKKTDLKKLGSIK